MRKLLYKLFGIPILYTKFSDFTPDYLNMDAAELDYPNGSELGEIFAALESLKQELQVIN